MGFDAGEQWSLHSGNDERVPVEETWIPPDDNAELLEAIVKHRNSHCLS